jgi:endonuclease/exonuclease/phosphatase family metal-dependent hydrolase
VIEGVADGAALTDAALAQAADALEVGAVVDSGCQERLEQPGELGLLRLRERLKELRQRGAARGEQLVEDLSAGGGQVQLQAAAASVPSALEPAGVHEPLDEPSGTRLGQPERRAQLLQGATGRGRDHDQRRGGGSGLSDDRPGRTLLGARRLQCKRPPDVLHDDAHPSCGVCSLAHYGAWPQRRAVLMEGLQELDPDLVAFVEPIERDGYDQTAELLGPGYHVVYQAERDDKGSGVSIASRWPLERVHEVDLRVTPRTSDSLCRTLVAEVRAPEPIGPLLFAAANPSWEMNRERERELQAVATARFLEQLAGERTAHVVLAGDFDAVPEAASIRFISGRQSLEGLSVCYRDAWETIHGAEPGHTFTARNPLVADGEAAWDVDRRIDYIFVRCAHGGPTLDIRSCERLFDVPVDGVWASDHFGVVADLAVPTRDRPFHV